MPSFSEGLFDRLDDDDERTQGRRRGGFAPAFEAFKQCITHDLEALLNTRTALLPPTLAPFPAVAGSIVNYGLIDFAGMCTTSEVDRQQICNAVRLTIERHEPRLHKIAVTLGTKQGAINRVEFVITARLKCAPHAEPMSFNAIFRPSLQQYSVSGTF